MSDLMQFHEAIRMVTNEYSTVAQMVQAHRSLRDDQESNKLLLECAVLSVIWRTQNKPRAVADLMAARWQKLRELNAVAGE